MKTKPLSVLILALLTVGLAVASAQNPAQQAPGEKPNLPGHVYQSDIDSGKLTLDDLADAGRFLFTTEFNILDGFGRPAATGNGTPTKRVFGSAPFMIRTSAPETNSCAGCHNKPEAGGAGDFVANVFVLSQVKDPVNPSVGPEASDERNTLGMHGSGPIEMLAREMTADLLAIRKAAIAGATTSGQPVTLSLVTKDVSFGLITAKPDGSVDNSLVEGVDADLVIKPFHQKGVVRSVREFTVNAFNHHHGLQAVERFGRGRTGEDDFDEDGVPDELSVGDITAATLFQVSLQTPGQALPADPVARKSIARGEQLFNETGCAVCHRPSLTLNNSVFSEPNPYNVPGNLRLIDVPKAFSFDLTKDGPKPRLEKAQGGGAIVRAYTDLKRHIISDLGDEFFNNERLIQGGVPTDEFITRKLWDCGSSSPFGHRGDCTTVSEAILHHGGEGRPSRDAFAALSDSSKSDIIDFLKSLQVLPAGSPRVVIVQNRIPRAFR